MSQPREFPAELPETGAYDPFSDSLADTGEVTEVYIESYGDPAAYDATRVDTPVFSAIGYNGGEPTAIYKSADRRVKNGAPEGLKTATKLTAFVVAGLALASAALAARDGGDKGITPLGATTTTIESAAECVDSWEIVQANHGTNNQWFADGVPEILAARSRADALQASTVWLNKVKTDPELLAGASSIFLGRNFTPTTLIGKDGCVNDTAKGIYADLSRHFSESLVQPALVPESGIVTGVDGNGRVVVGREPGVTGDRRGILISQPDGGLVVHVLGRGGQPVVFSRGRLLEGPTDEDGNPRPTTTTTTTLRSTTTTSSASTTTSTTLPSRRSRGVDVNVPIINELIGNTTTTVPLERQATSSSTTTVARNATQPGISLPTTSVRRP